MTLKDHFRRSWKGYLVGAVTGLFSVPVFYWPLLWNAVTDDGHGVYTAPGDIDPAPKLPTPWPPFAPPEGPLPRLSLADIDTYFFPQDAEEAENGLAIWRFDAPSLALSSSGKDDRNDEAVLLFYEKITSEVEGLPPAYLLYAPDGSRTREYSVEKIRFYLARKEFKEDYRWRDNWASRGSIGERMEAIGCVSTPALPRNWSRDQDFMVPLKSYALETAFIATWHRLDEPTVDHCLFKALLVALGLHPTKGFFFKEGPVTPEEQARALAALQLVYHPAVKPGMTKDEFVGTLLAEGLIDP
jgi:hypothetical protein